VLTADNLACAARKQYPSSIGRLRCSAREARTLRGRPASNHRTRRSLCRCTRSLVRLADDLETRLLRQTVERHPDHEILQPVEWLEGSILVPGRPPRARPHLALFVEDLLLQKPYRSGPEEGCGDVAHRGVAQGSLEQIGSPMPAECLQHLAV